MTSDDEPQIHSHLRDELPESHPLAWTHVFCAVCDALVHAGNNECMRTWVEFSNANVCAKCVGPLSDVLESNEWRSPT